MSASNEHLDYLLTAYLFENITPEGKAKVEAHLEACPECRAELEALRRTFASVKGALGPVAGGLEEAPSKVLDLEKVLRSRPRRGIAGWFLAKPLRIPAAAAAVLIAGILGISIVSSLATPRFKRDLVQYRMARESRGLGEDDSPKVILNYAARIEEAPKAASPAEMEIVTAVPAPSPTPPAVAQVMDDSASTFDTGALANKPLDPNLKGPQKTLGAAQRFLEEAAEVGDASKPVDLAAAIPGATPGATPASSAPAAEGAAASGKYASRFGAARKPQAGVAGRIDASGRIDAGGESPALQIASGEGGSAAAGDKQAKTDLFQILAPQRSKGEGGGLGGGEGKRIGGLARAPVPAQVVPPAGPTMSVILQDHGKFPAIQSVSPRGEVRARAEEPAAVESELRDGEKGEEQLKAGDPALEPGERGAKKDEIALGNDAIFLRGDTNAEIFLESRFLGIDDKALKDLGLSMSTTYESLGQQWGMQQGRDHAARWFWDEAQIQGQDGASRNLQVQGWGLSSALGDVPEMGRLFALPAQIALETRLRAFRHWRALDPSLTPEAFSARALPVPPPAVGDEGLGQEEFRKRYGVHPFVDTSRDHLSTFGMDVDTASYTLARNTIRSGKLPEPKTVRVEEFVNYFREEAPADPEKAFSVFSEGGPSPFGQSLDLLKVSVKARDLRKGERKAAVLTFAIDTSGSMATPSGGPGGPRAGDSRLSLVRKALATLIKSLDSDDRVGIVSYSTGPSLVLPHTPARERGRILGAIDSLAPGGATNVEAGLDLAYRLADEVSDQKAVNRVILCTDGAANAGGRTPEEILRKVEVYKGRGIFLSCVGFGMGRYNDALLEALANKGNGNYAYVDSAAEAEKVFRQNLPSTLQVLAQDAKIQVDWNPEAVSHYRLLGYEDRDIADKDFRNDKVDAGEVGPGSSVTALYEIRRKANPKGDLGRIFLRFKDTGTGKVEEENYPLRSGVLATDLRETSERFRFIACVSEMAELLRESYWSRDGSYGKVISVLASLSPGFRSRPEWRELADLALRAEALAVAKLAAK